MKRLLLLVTLGMTLLGPMACASVNPVCVPATQTRHTYLDCSRQLAYWNRRLAQTEEGKRLGLNVLPPPMDYTMADGTGWSLSVEEMTNLLNLQEGMFIEAIGITADKPWYTALEWNPEEQKDIMESLHKHLRSAARQLLYVGAPALTTEKIDAVIYAMEKQREYHAMPQWVDRRTRQPYTREQENAIALAQWEIGVLLGGTNPVARNENQAWQIWIARSDNASYATQIRQWARDALANPAKTDFAKAYLDYLKLLTELN